MAIGGEDAQAAHNAKYARSIKTGCSSSVAIHSRDINGCARPRKEVGAQRLRARRVTASSPSRPPASMQSAQRAAETRCFGWGGTQRAVGGSL